MTTSPTPAPTVMRDWKWSPAEKAIARGAFHLALERELEAVVREAKARAARIAEPSELWELEGWLTRRRHEMDSKYDFRYSVLPVVLARLLREERIAWEDLNGLDRYKLERIRHMATREPDPVQPAGA